MGDLMVKEEEKAEVNGGVKVKAYSEEQVNAAAKLISEGVEDSAVLMVAGLSRGELAELKEGEDFRELVGELRGKREINDIMLDTQWEQVEDAALGSVLHDVRHGGDAMTPMEKLAIAKAANGAKKRNGKLAENRKARLGQGGIIEGGLVENRLTVVNLTVPNALLSRLESLNAKDSQVIEGELAQAKDFEEHAMGELNLDDVQRVFNVDVKNGGSGGLSNISSTVSDMIEGENIDIGNVFG